MKTALVTGTKMGVGNGLVSRLLSLGYKVIATSRDPIFVFENRKNFGWDDNVSIDYLDLTDITSIEALCHKYRDVTIDLLIHNAGGGSYSGGDEKIFDSLVYSTSLNISGPAHLTNLLLKNLQKSDNPTVIFISSFAGKNPYPGDISYCVSKNAVSQLAKICRMELQNKGIKVTEIMPASINTREDNPNVTHLNVEDMVNAIIWVSELPKHCNIDLIEISEVRTRKNI